MGTLCHRGTGLGKAWVPEKRDGEGGDGMKSEPEAQGSFQVRQTNK